MKFKNSNGEWQNVKISNYGIEQTPIGSMIYYPSQTIPQGYLVCDGREILIADYPLLFNAIGYVGGKDVDTGYFRLPDMRGTIPAGYYEGLNSSPLAGDFGDTVGDSTHVLTVDEMPSHTHKVEKVATFGHSSGVNFGATGDWQGQGSIQTVASGGGQPHSIVQPTKLYHWLIKAKNMVTLGGYTEDFNVDGSLNVKGDLKFNDVHLNDLMNDIVGDTVPIGAVIEWDNDTIPDNWLLLDGRAVSRTEYKELFALYGTRYGAGDGSTTFNLPNRKTRVSVGKDSSDSDFNTLGKTGGEKKHTLTTAEMPSHRHSLQTNINATSFGSNNSLARGAGGTTEWKGNDAYIETAGSDQPHNNLQPYIVTNFIVKAKQSAGLVANVIDNLNSTSEVDALSANQGKVLNDKITGKTLWSNSNPNTGFVAQNIILSSSDYEMLLILYKDNKDDNRLMSQITLKGYGVTLLAQEGGTATPTYLREIEYVSDTVLSVKNGANPGVAWVNDYAIPFKIIGYKI